VVAGGTLVAVAVARTLREVGVTDVEVIDGVDGWPLIEAWRPRAVFADVEVDRGEKLLAMARYLVPVPALVALADSPLQQQRWKDSAIVVRAGDQHALVSALNYAMRS